jgi:hypothetical protein
MNVNPARGTYPERKIAEFKDAESADGSGERYPSAFGPSRVLRLDSS